MSENRLHYNASTLREQSTNIANIADEIQQAKTDLLTNLNTLHGEWKSTAANKFFDSIDTDWTTAVQKYVDMLNDLSEALLEAAQEYEPLEDEYNKLSL